MNTSHPNKGRSKALAIKRVPTPHNCCSSSKSPTPQDKRSPYNHKPKSSPHMACSYSQEASLSQEPETSRNYEASLSLQERQEDSQESGMTGRLGQEERMKAESQSQEEGEGEVSGEYQSEKSVGEKFNEISSPKSSKSMGDEEVRERMEEGSEEPRSEDEQGDTEEKDDEGEDGNEEEEEVESKEDGEKQVKEEKKIERNVVMERSLNEVRIEEKKEPETKDRLKPMLKPERSWPLPNPAKKYNLLEDCKILKLAETIRKKQDSKGLMSVSLWESCTDKETGLKLLGNRTGESLRERYRRYLVFLTSEQKEMIKKFAKEHRGEDLGEYSCVFQTVNGKREFVQIERSKKKKDKKPRLETPKKLNIIEDLRQQERSGSSQIRTPRFESHGEKKAPPVSMRGESSGGDVFVQEFEREPVMRCGDGLSLIERIREDRQDFTSMSSVWVRAEDCSRGSQSKRTVKERSRQETVRSNDDVLLKRMVMDDMTLGSYGDMVYWGERKKVKKEVEGKVVEAAAMRSGRDDGYEELREKKPRKMNLNMMICVDEENQMRWFSKKDEEEEEEREKEKESGWKVEKMRIGKISKEYGIPLHSMLELFNLVSGDYGDLEEYLKKGDENVLWSREDDEGLIMENETALRYLRRLKGVERMEKRRLYLLGKNVGKGRFLFQKNETRDTR